MRLVLVLAVTVVAALSLTGLASAQQQARCSGTMTVGGKRIIIVGLNTDCTETKAILRPLVTAPTIGQVRQGGLTLLKLRSPRAGWVCATTSAIRSRGAGCKKTGTMKTVIYVNPAG